MVIELRYKLGDIRVTDYFLSRRLGRKLRKNVSDQEAAKHLEKTIKLLVTQIAAEEAGKELEETRRKLPGYYPPAS